MHRHSVFVYFRIDSFNYNSFVQGYPYFGDAYSSLFFTYNTASQHIHSLAYLSKDGDDLFADRLPCIIFDWYCEVLLHVISFDRLNTILSAQSDTVLHYYAN